MTEQKPKPVDPKDREKVLQTLYPKPKTFDELHQQNLERQARIQKRQPKFIGARVALELTVLFALFLLTVSVVPQEYFWNVTGGVPLGFVLGLMIVGLEFWMATRASRLFDYNGFNPRPFIVTYFMCAVMLFYMRPSNEDSGFPDAGVITGLIVAHFLVAWFLGKVTLTKRFSPRRKFATMTATFIVLCIAAVASKNLI